MDLGQGMNIVICIEIPPNKPSQFTFKRNEDGVRCLVYSEDTITKTNDRGIDSLKKDRRSDRYIPLIM